RELVRHQRHRRDAALHVARRALVADDREHVVVVGVLRGDRLVRLSDARRQGEPSGDDKECDGGAEREAWSRACHHRGNTDWMIASASANCAYAATIWFLLPMSPNASSRYDARTSFAIAGSASSRFSGGSPSSCDASAITRSLAWNAGT